MPNWIGDAVMATPALGALRRGFPRAEITAVAVPLVHELLAHHAHLDRSIRYDSGSRHAGLRGSLEMVRLLRAEGFNLAVLFPNGFDAALMAWLAGVPRRVGYARDARGLLLTSAVPLPGEPLHQAASYLRIVQAALPTPLGCDPAGLEPTLMLEAADHEAAASLLDSALPRSLVGICPGAVYGPAKRWLPRRFAEVADRLADRHGVAVAIFGGAEERGIADQVASAMRHPSLVLAGRATLRQSMAILSRCRLLVCNDSGLMHVAAALGVPVVAVFGPTDPRATAPLGGMQRLLRVDVSCAPCRFRKCPIDHRCMARVTEDAVCDAAAELLQGSGRANPPAPREDLGSGRAKQGDS